MAIKKLKMVVNTDCFAYRNKGGTEYCDALDVGTCANCNFYKTEKNYRNELIRLYGCPEVKYRGDPRVSHG